jgi:hypothetical protein
MNFRRGFFRLWIVLTVLWIVGMSWAKWDTLLGRPWTFDWPQGGESWKPPLIVPRGRAVMLITLPPLGLLGFGCALFWVAYGFRRKNLEQ